MRSNIREKREQEGLAKQRFGMNDGGGGAECNDGADFEQVQLG